MDPDMMYFENGEITAHFVLFYFGLIVTLYTGNVVMAKLFAQPKLRCVKPVTLVILPFNRCNGVAKAKRRRLIKFRRLPESTDEDPIGLCLPIWFVSYKP